MLKKILKIDNNIIKLDNNNKYNINDIIDLNNENDIIDLNNENNTIDDNDIIIFSSFNKKEKMLYEVINNFFNNFCSSEEINMMNEIINSNHKISLRFLDWFVTRYCVIYKLSIPVNNNYNKESTININISYKAQLKSYTKKYFDPFRRKKKFVFSVNNNQFNILTTLGQLNFFRWALSNDVIKYTEDNFKIITSKDIIKKVDSYFKKNIIDINSLTNSTSEENNQTISLDNNKSHNVQNNFELKNKKSNKIYKNLQVTRNIFIEF